MFKPDRENASVSDIILPYFQQRRNHMENKKGTQKNRIVPEIIFFLLILILCLVHAKVSVHNADFGPLNGTFQDFNPIRRFLSGQVPYRDFSDYLGLGHLYIGTITTLLFGKSFVASKTAFVFLAFFSLSLLSLSLGTAVLRFRIRGLTLTVILLSLLLIRPLFLEPFVLSEEAREAFDYALKNGNSARMVRAFILPLVSCALILFFSAKKTRPRRSAGIMARF